MGLFSRNEKPAKPVKQIKKTVKNVSKKQKPVKVSKPLPKIVKAVKVEKIVPKAVKTEKVAPKPAEKRGIVNDNEIVYDQKKVAVVKNVTESVMRTYRPRIDLKKCQKTYNCFMFCPRNAILINAEGHPVINYTLCDGCLICLRECPAVAITEEKE
jgi:2-oxoacid:acceptor oxidoreductase delta subunit (pyruvate/2-ketoisovalerate family)